MKKLISGLSLGVVALLFSIAGMAATVTVVPSNATPDPGQQFTITIHGDAFAGDGTTTGTTGSTLTITYDSSVVTLLSDALAAGSPFDFITPPTVVDANTVIISVLRNAAGYASGSFDAYTVTFQVNANAAGGAAANIVVVDDGVDNSWTDQDANPIPVTYTQANVTVAAAAGAPDITVTTSVAFGNVDVNSTGSNTITVTNDGTADLVLGTIANSNPLAAPFSIANDNCSGQTVAAAGTCTFDVQFAPTAAGDVTDTFDIPSNDADEASVTVTVSGGGGPSSVTITDSDTTANDQTLTFGAVDTGTTKDLTVTLTSGGPGTLHVTTVGTPSDAHFTLQNNTCNGMTLTPAATCTFDVRFAPDAVNTFTGTVAVNSDDPASPSTINLTGDGQTPANADISVSLNSPFDFGSVQVGDTSPATTVTITNNGGADLTFTGFTGLAAPFALSNPTCAVGTPVPPAGTCTFDLTFSPTAVGAVTDTLDIGSNDPDTATVSLVLNGTGTAGPTPDIGITDSDATPGDSQLTFGNVPVGQTSSAFTVTVTNVGGADLVLGTVGSGNALGGDFAIAADNCSGLTLTPAQTCTIDVTFAPTAAGAASEAFDIPSNDPDTPSAVVNVTGTGTAPEISVSATTVDFGDVAPGATASQNITVTNLGNVDLVIGAGGVTAPATAQYTITANTCTANVHVAANGTCTITVQFAPDADQTFDDSIDIPSNDADEATVTVDLTGVGSSSIPGLSGGSSFDLETLLGLSLLGYAIKRRRLH